MVQASCETSEDIGRTVEAFSKQLFAEGNLPHTSTTHLTSAVVLH